MVACRVEEDVRDLGRRRGNRGDDGHAAGGSSQSNVERLDTSCGAVDL